MQTLSTQELLSIWGEGALWSPVFRALKLLAFAFPETSLDDLERFSIGQRDALLLMLREQTFGSRLVCLARCPSCDERLEMALTVRDILIDPGIGSGEVLSIAVSGYEVQFRLVCSLDLIAIADVEDPTLARNILLDRCILQVLRDGKETSADELPINVLNAVVDRMEEADPQADVQLSLACPSCDNQWDAGFDIFSFFWSEIDNWAHRILREVHTLARAYGWSESDILKMSPLRRQLYLEMASE